MKINNLRTNVFLRLLTCQHLFCGSESETKNDFAVSVAGSVSSSFSLQARRRAASLSAVSPHPAVPHLAVFTSDRPWRVQSSGASEHVAGWWRGGGCGNWEKGQRPKTLSRTSSCFHGLWHPGHAAWNIKTGCHAATNEKSKSLKCICLFLKWG